jgi:hypothetical protein
MKKSDDKFEWTEEADTAFAQLKKVLSTPPVLVAPKEKEPPLLQKPLLVTGLFCLSVMGKPPVTSMLSLVLSY